MLMFADLSWWLKNIIILQNYYSKCSYYWFLVTFMQNRKRDPKCPGRVYMPLKMSLTKFHSVSIQAYRLFQSWLKTTEESRLLILCTTATDGLSPRDQAPRQSPSASFFSTLLNPQRHRRNRPTLRSLFSILGSSLGYVVCRITNRPAGRVGLRQGTQHTARSWFMCWLEGTGAGSLVQPCQTQDKVRPHRPTSLRSKWAENVPAMQQFC